jgi:hypothetical protein
MLKLRGVLAAVVLIVGAAEVRADSVAFSPTGGTFNTASFNQIGNDGFSFTVGSLPIAVTSLGYFHDGTVHSNPVGIYDVSTQSLVVSTVVTTTSSALGVPSFDYQSIAQTVLTPGHSYEVVGFEGGTGSQIYAQYTTAGDASHLNPASGISFGKYFYDFNGSLDLPSYGNNVGDSNPYGVSPDGSSYMGPNFQFEILGGGSTAVPLPASLWGGGALLAGTAVVRKARARRA